MVTMRVILSLAVILMIGTQTANGKKCGFSRYLDAVDIRGKGINLTTPNYPNTFKGPATCEWELSTMFDLWIKVGDISPSSCKESILSLEDVEGANAILGTFCGANLTTKVRVYPKSSKIRVRLRILADKPEFRLRLTVREFGNRITNLVKDQKPGAVILSETNSPGRKMVWSNWNGYLIGQQGISFIYVTIPNFNRTLSPGFFKVFSVFGRRERVELWLSKLVSEKNVKLYSSNIHLFFYYYQEYSTLPQSTIKYIGCGRHIKATSDSVNTFDVDMSLFPPNAECFYQLNGAASTQLLIGLVTSTSCTVEIFDRPLSRDYPGPSYGYTKYSYYAQNNFRERSDILYLQNSTGLIKVTKGQSCDYKFQFNVTTCGYSKTVSGSTSGEINFNIPYDRYGRCTWKISQDLAKKWGGDPWIFKLEVESNMEDWDQLIITHGYWNEAVSKSDAGKKKEFTIRDKTLGITFRAFGGRRSSFRVKYKTELRKTW